MSLIDPMDRVLHPVRHPRPGVWSDQGPRPRQQDAAAVAVAGLDRRVGALMTYGHRGAALMDGFGGHPAVEEVTQRAARRAAEAAAARGALAGLAAAAEVVRAAEGEDDDGPDCVGAVVAVEQRQAAWTGDVRVYTWRRADHTLTLHTADHTEGAAIRARLADGTAAGEQLGDPAEYDHVITTSIGCHTAPETPETDPRPSQDRAGWVMLPGDCDAIILTCDGVHDALTHEDMWGTVLTCEKYGAEAVARALVEDARAADAARDPEHRVDDNATCVVIPIGPIGA
ncbi:hypothetical protein [Marinactinospora rubrisoli]|uniref:PPM-type phosphatase domain-containing protein n=1 Tax=Marinactinospora rubrisoli TaxID=2715399 RepID=A0ABW2KQ17_9ACTN